ncbi:MAG TPA: hypothetical protein VFJ74_04135 [Gemmatimonadaceae bacterium]|nr:hypothetical protein [Gemmatimonadaceae bacterium]
MSSPSRRRPTLAIAVALAVATMTALGACGGGAGDTERDTVAANESAAGGDSASGDDGAPDVWDISAADVDAYVRSLDVKTDSIREGSKRVRAMKDSPQRDTAYVRVAHTLTYYDAMVKASGLGLDRYQEVANHLEDAHNVLADDSTSEETRRETLAHLRPETLEALKRSTPHITKALQDQSRLVAEAGGYDKLLTK